ncbi:MAG: GNAT family N-acetyltransferase, partial [bacterium]|nr:GNAT family N-acetyltransferase [Candidatus Kapabacteria bacterium]
MHGDGVTKAVGSPLRWQCIPFSELSVEQLYDALHLRELVFVVEQKCAYVDADGHDPRAMHLLGYTASAVPSLVAYARLFAPGVKYKEASIGRGVTH